MNWGSVRAAPKKVGGLLYNQESDEREDPIWIDLDRFELEGVRVIGQYTYEIVLQLIEKAIYKLEKESIPRWNKSLPAVQIACPNASEFIRL